MRQKAASPATRWRAHRRIWCESVASDAPIPRLHIGATRWVDVDVCTRVEARSYLEQALTDAGVGGLEEADELGRDLG
jgi:N-glycosylase/DNA lyase